MSILNLLEQKGIFSICKAGDGFELTEECDQWFAVTLTREQVLQLAEELKTLARAPETIQTKDGKHE